MTPLPFRLLPASFLRALLDALSDDGVLILSPSGRIVEINTQALQWAAMTRKELLGQDLGLLFPPALRQQGRWVLRNRHGTTQFVSVREIHLINGYRVLRICSWSEAQAREKASTLHEEAGRILRSLLDRISTPFEAFALQLVLEEIHPVAMAQWAAFYALGAGEWQLLAGSGPLPDLPLSIAWEAPLPSVLLHPQLWGPRNRQTLPDSPWAQIIRSQGYVYTFPIGEPPTPHGLLMLAYEEKPPEALLTPLLLTVAHLLSAWERLHRQTLQYKTECRTLTEQAQLGTQLWRWLPLPALILDGQGYILTTNQPVLHLLGYQNDEVQDLPGEQVIILQERSDLPLFIEQALQQGREQTLEGVHLIRRSGESFPATLHFLPLSSERLLLLIQDHTPDVQAVTLERRALLGTLLASYAHEIRNPLNNLSTGLEYLLLTIEDLPDEDGADLRDTLERMRQDIERLETMSRRLLQFARPAGDLGNRRVKIQTLLHNLVYRWQPRFSRYNIEVLWQIPEDLPPVCGDAVLLEQAFANLVDNAIQALKQHTLPRQIVLRGVHQAQHIEIIIADNGPGVPAEIQKRIFEPFFTTRTDGHGLGLALVRKTITDHRGGVSLESYPGQGTLFRIRLPVSRHPAC